MSPLVPPLQVIAYVPAAVDDEYAGEVEHVGSTQFGLLTVGSIAEPSEVKV
jgi:hypothetical protein